ncbi:ABC transporter ATP-binding protein [Amycolatopsis ultiminotia]|uniref:ABC transporter ATP-binding protein n=1 Tax=Amycolatopsis ultiminotia TaxID=543629 RepID=A0ABP6W5V8_9PSEU
MDGARRGRSAELVSVTKAYRDVVALDGVSLGVAAGEFVVVVGPSGSGKTTAMRVLGGFEQPDRGQVLIGGQEVTQLPAQHRDVNTVFQNYALFPHLSVADNIAYGLRMRGVKAAQRRAAVSDLLDLVRLPGLAGRRPAQLSGGQQQRVALARALARQPGVLLLDEPLGALDRKLRDEVQTELRRINRELGTSFVHITHDQDEAFALADRIVVLNEGRVEQQGAPAEVYDFPATLWTARFVGAQNFVPGRAERVTGSSVTVAADVGEFTAEQVHGPIEPGSAVVLAVRPERVTLEPAGGPAETSGAGPQARVTEIIAVGPDERITAETPGGTVFTALRARHGSPAPLAAGDPVRVRWPPAAAQVYPRPSAELSNGAPR